MFLVSVVLYYMRIRIRSMKQQYASLELSLYDYIYLFSITYILLIYLT